MALTIFHQYQVLTIEAMPSETMPKYDKLPFTPESSPCTDVPTCDDPPSTFETSPSSNTTNLDLPPLIIDSSPYSNIIISHPSLKTEAPASSNTTGSDSLPSSINCSPPSNLTDNHPPVTVTLLCANNPTCDKLSSLRCGLCKFSPYCLFTRKNQNEAVHDLFCQEFVKFKKANHKPSLKLAILLPERSRDSSFL